MQNIHEVQRMKMTYKSAQKIRLTLLTVGLVVMGGAMFIYDDILAMAVGTIGVTIIIAGMTVYYFYGRCPVCQVFIKAHKWRSFRLPDNCSECGEKLE